MFYVVCTRNGKRIFYSKFLREMSRNDMIIVIMRYLVLLNEKKEKGRERRGKIDKE